MKKFLLLLFIILNIQGFSQKYQPVDSTTVWQTKCLRRICTPSCCSIWEYASFQFHGYELNNGNKWLKLYSSAVSDWVICQPMCNQISSCLKPGNFTDQFYGYVLNDSLNKKVYFTPTLTPNYAPTNNDIAYDFLNKNVGDSLSYKGYFSQPLPKFPILSIDSILLVGKYHKRYLVKTINAWGYEIYIVEGVGSSKGPWNTIPFDGEHSSILTCFSKPTHGYSVSSPTTFVSNPGTGCATITAVPEIELPAFSLRPNPGKDQLIVEGLPVEKATIMDAFGKTISEQYEASKINIQSLPPGIYLIRLNSGNRIYVSKFIKE